MEKITTDFIDKYNLIVGTVVTILTAILGVYWYVFAAYLLLNTIDWLTGWAKARKLGKESSKKGLAGIIKKFGYWVIILIAFLIPSVFVNFGKDLLGLELGFLNLLGWLTLAMLTVNELRSIIENLVEMGYQVPSILMQGLSITEKLLKSKEESEE